MLLRYALFLAFVTAVAVGLSLLPAHGDSTIALTSWSWRSTAIDDRAPLDEHVGDAGDNLWTEFTLPGSPAAPLEGMLWMRARLPDRSFVDPAIAIDAVTGPTEVWLDGTRLYALPEGEGVEAKYPGGFPWMMVRLPAGYEGKTLVLRLRPDYRPLGVRGTPALGSRADLLDEVVLRDVPRLVVGMLTLLIGLLATAVLYRRESRRLFVSYGVTMIAYGLYVVVYTHLKDRLCDAPRFWFFLWLAVVPVVCVSSSALVDELFGSGPRGILRRVHQVFVVIASALVVIDPLCVVLYGTPGARAFAIHLFGAGLLVLRVTLGLALLAVLVPIARRARHGDRDARLLLYGFTIVCVFSVREVLSSVGVAAFAQKSHFYLGTFALTLAFTLIVQRRYALATERAARFAQEISARTREKERFLRDLHDGVGGLTSNVRMLAELGQKSDARARTALETIAELSRESLAELRLFVHALDESETSWTALAAELRRFGASLVEQTGRRFTMEVVVERVGAADGALRLNLLRIYREALTNALKQKDATAVEVRLSVLPDVLTMVVANDGGSGQREAVGIDAGRGVAHMRTRAQEIGGELRISHGERVEVTLRIPNKPPESSATAALK